MVDKPLNQQAWGWITKKLVSKACDAGAKQISKMGNKFNESERKAVERLLCDSIKLATDVAVSGETDSKKLARKVGEHMVQNGIDITKLTGNQQALCVAAIAELALTAPAAVKEIMSTYRDTVSAAEVGSFIEPGVGTAIGAGASLAWHYPTLAKTTTAAMDAGFDMYSQCGPLLFDKVDKPRGINSQIYLNYEDMVCRDPEAVPEQSPVNMSPQG